MTSVIAYFAIGVLAAIGWFSGAILPKLRRGPTTLISASALFLAGLAAQIGGRFELLPVGGADSMLIYIFSLSYLLLGSIGITIGVLIRSKLRPFGIIEEDY